MPLQFIFDINKCTGCNACQIACSLENEVDWGTNWRQVVTFNADHVPDLPTYHVSMACNHCGDPPCLKYCPALAITKHDISGIVNIDPAKCFGCKYCSWTCPYDAPKFNKHMGVMEKCTFCTQRLEDHTEPACVALCPTGALNYEDLPKTKNYPEVGGFHDYNIEPSLYLVPWRENSALQNTSDSSLPYDSDLLARFRSGLKTVPSRISLRSEWTLLVFTLIAALLVGIRAMTIFSTLPVSPLIFLLSGLAAMGISTLHLGRKMRAHRAVLNWRRSWLSREIIFFGIFLALVICQDWIFPGQSIFAYLSFTAGLIALFCMDRVYGVLRKQDDAKWHSAVLFLSAIYFAGIVTSTLSLALPAGIFKLFLYMKRCGKPGWQESLRILAGFVIPGALWLLFPALNPLYILGVVLVGEIVDRIDFYSSLDLASPRARVITDFRESLDLLKRT